MLFIEFHKLFPLIKSSYDDEKKTHFIFLHLRSKSHQGVSLKPHAQHIPMQETILKKALIKV